MANQNVKETQQQEKVIETVSKSEQFYNKNKKLIWGCIIAVVVVGLGILGYHKFIYEPKAAEAAAQMFPAEASFQKGEFELALNGDGNNLGFNQIITDYGNKAGKAVYLYAGLCNLNLGNWQEAIDLLKKYKGKDEILAARTLASIGDAYTGLEDYNTALTYFQKAAAMSDNVYAASYILKQGAIYEELGQKDKALECYNKIQNDYPQSIEGYDIDKYITRIQGVE